MNQPSIAGKKILLLQGPVGPFFRNLAKDLRRQGATVYKYNFNAGDWLFYPTGAHSFRGDLSTWKGVLEAFLRTNHIDAILLFGDCRPVHAVVRSIAPAMNIEVGVFEEGYLRPDFVTLEQGGVNGFSSFTQRYNAPTTLTANDQTCAVAGLQQQSSQPPIEQVGNAFWHSAAWGMLYFFAAWVGQWMWNNHLHHRPMSVLDSPWWWLSFGRKLWFKHKEKGIQEWLVKDKHQQFFLVPLQVYNDAQILVHSDYASVMQFIAHVMKSYAKALAKASVTAESESTRELQESVLVFKHHPMDRGHRNYACAIDKLSQRLGLQGRVHYIHDQHLPTLLKAARGVVVVNSTVGLSALAHGAAVKVCGRALYDQPGMTFQGPLSQFWHSALQQRPCKDKVHAFKTQLIAQTQVNGNFYRKLHNAGTHCGIALKNMLAFRLWGKTESVQVADVSEKDADTQTQPLQRIKKKCRKGSHAH